MANTYFVEGTWQQDGNAPVTQNLAVILALASWIKAGGYKIIGRDLLCLDT